MFKDKNKPSMNELINWFMRTYPDLVDDMHNSMHAVETKSPNPFHSGDNSILCHTMLVCQRAEIASEESYNKLSLICALLHDIGKPEAREVVDHVNKETDKINKRARFFGHEGLSAHKSIEILNDLVEFEIIDKQEREMCFRIISMHGSLFDNIKDGEMYKPEKVWNKFIPSKKINGILSNFDHISLDIIKTFFKKRNRTL